MDSKFNEWYEKNKSYFFVKHNGDESRMEEDAIQSYNIMMIASTSPVMANRGKDVKKKVNQYGF